MQFVQVGGPGMRTLPCEAPPYNPECAPCAPCNPCEPKCPPKTRAADAITIQRNEVERCFNLTSFGCKPETIYANQHCFMLKVRKRGTCFNVAVLDPVRALPEGAVCFSWGRLWTDLGQGYYEADLYTDGQNCNTLLFYVRGCDVLVHDSVPVIDEPCPIDATPCCGTTPQIDEVTAAPASCEDECSTCEEPND